MSKTAKRLATLRTSPQNVAFSDLVAVVRACGFNHVRTTGSHQMYAHTRKDVPMLNLQDSKGQAKSYQVRQVLAVIDAYGLEA